MTFDDFHPGQRLTYGPATISESDILAFANAYDPQWFHVDPARAGGSRWKGLIASGWHTCSIAMRLVVDARYRIESFGSPGLEYLKWLAPVRPGDELTVYAEVLDVSVGAQCDWRLRRWRWQLVNQAGAAGAGARRHQPVRPRARRWRRRENVHDAGPQ
jgi:acyl dehydratase